MTPLDILFVQHDGGLTGAPLVLLHFQRWLKSRGGVSFATIVRSPGALVPRMTEVGETLVHPAAGPAVLPSLARRLARRLGYTPRPPDPHAWLAPWSQRPIRLIYSNTVTNGAVVEALSHDRVPVITHVHELGYWIRNAGPANWEHVLRQTSLFIAASEAVADHLRHVRGIPADRVEVVHEFIPTQLPEGLAATGARTRAELGIPKNAFVVCGGGAEIWRKGGDLFVQLAAALVRSLPGRPCAFLWVGRHPEGEARHWLWHDVEQAGLGGVMHWIGEIPDPLRYFAAGDAFAMVSREDPFPLVCLESSLVGRPVVCFAGAGGVPELVGEGAGFTVPYLDVTAMAGCLRQWATDEPLRERMGRHAAARVRERFSVEAAAPRLLAAIERTMQGPARPAGRPVSDV